MKTLEQFNKERRIELQNKFKLKKPLKDYSWSLTLEIKHLLKDRMGKLKPARQKKLNRLIKYQLISFGAFKLARMIK